MNIERLQTKKAALTAQREQHMANINATIGAIAMVDELLQEAVADQVREKMQAEQKAWDAAHAEHMAKMASPPPLEIERAAALRDTLKVKLDPQDVQRVSRPFEYDIEQAAADWHELPIAPGAPGNNWIDDAPPLQPASEPFSMRDRLSTDIFAPADGWYPDAESRN